MLFYERNYDYSQEIFEEGKCEAVIGDRGIFPDKGFDENARASLNMSLPDSILLSFLRPRDRISFRPFRA